ncbi:MAG: S8 family serine peptidase, partial [Ferruginibacter sp.]
AGQNIITLLCSYPEIEKFFLKEDKVIFIDAVSGKPKTELGTPGFDLSANKINVVHSQYPSISGLGQHVSIKEDYYDTTDIDIKGRFEPSPLASRKITNHANFMATIIAGAGNSVYYAEGAAWAALVSSSSFEQVLPDADSYYAEKKITVQNHSYGTSIDNNYGLAARAFDKSANASPNLLHVFSSGNSGNASSTNGIYSGIANYANLTGNFKMAKNILTVGAVDSLGNTVLLSSSGPAYDGRIKPDLVAFQQNGTSEAAALVSGTSLLLQHYFKSVNNNSALPSALAKAILINTANDISTPGPDYKTGFGNMDALKAMDLVKANNIFTGTSTPGATQTFSINVPANITLLKVTLVWNDTAATVAAPSALVNDLDLELSLASTTQRWKPWVLNSFPNADSLNNPAVRKRDSINNVEQVTLENPVPGNYEVKINGYNLPTASQQYFVAYSLDTSATFHWQKPTRSGFAETGTRTILRWQNTFTGTGSIEYSFADNNWLPLASIDLSTKYFYWNVPDTITAALLRMKIGNTYFNSDTFLITSFLKPTTGFICGDSVLLYWNKLKNIQLYQVYQLGEKYMQTLTLVTDTTIVIAKKDLIDKYLAVAPILSNGITAPKSYAFDYTKQGAGCFINSFYADKDGETARLHLDIGTLVQVAEVIFQKQDISGYSTISSPPVTGQLQYVVDYGPLKTGITVFRVKIILTTGQAVYSNTEAVFYATPGQYVLFPIPAKRNNGFSILSGSPTGEIISLIDVMGRVVLQKPIIYPREFINTAALQAGQYFYRIIKNGVKVASGKLIIL